jgi:hypothetical protein
MGQDKHIDFRKALRLVEAQAEAPVEVRQRAFACWVALFDLADGKLRVETSARGIAEFVGVSRVTWIHYRAVLEHAGVLRVMTGSRGPHPQLMRLTPPYVR